MDGDNGDLDMVRELEAMLEVDKKPGTALQALEQLMLDEPESELEPELTHSHMDSPLTPDKIHDSVSRAPPFVCARLPGWRCWPRCCAMLLWGGIDRQALALFARLPQQAFVVILVAVGPVRHAPQFNLRVLGARQRVLLHVPRFDCIAR